MEAGEKEYTYMTISGAKYAKFFDIFRSIFYRTLWQAGIQEPRKFATDENRKFLLASYRALRTREGLSECFSKLRKAGFTVWCPTAGDTERVGGYLAKGGEDFPSENSSLAIPLAWESRRRRPTSTFSTSYPRRNVRSGSAPHISGIQPVRGIVGKLTITSSTW